MSHEDIKRLLSEADADVAANTAVLLPVLDTVKDLWQAGSIEVDEVAQTIADGSRQESWREPVGEAGILDFFLSLLATEVDLRPNLLLQILRLAGNACADTDANRQRVIDSGSLPKLVSLLNQDAVLPVILVVLNNFCNDHEPSQKAAYKAGLNPELVTILSGPRLEQARPYFSIIFRLLEELSSQEPEANFVHPATPFILLKLAMGAAEEGDLDDFLASTPVAITYLSHQQYQDSFVQTPGAVSLLLKAFSFMDKEMSVGSAESDDAERIKKVQSVFVQAIADISAHDHFASTYSLESEAVQTLIEWLSSPGLAKPTAASLALGNLARSDTVCMTLVQDLRVQKPVAALIADNSTTDAQLLHSSLSFLKNLAIPAINKATLGESGLLDTALPRLWGLTVQPQVQFAAISLTRLLLVQTVPNVSRMFEPSSPSSSATKFQSLLTAFKDSDQEPTKMEAARAALAVLRVLHSTTDLSEIFSFLSVVSPTLSPSTSKLDTFYTIHSSLVKPILFLSAQAKWPTLRSELWFILALISRSTPGAKFVIDNVVTEYDFLSELSRTISGTNLVEGREEEFKPEPTTKTAITTQENQATASEDSVAKGFTATPSVKLELEPQQVNSQAAAGLAKVDRENCIVLVHELVKQAGPQLSPPVVKEVMEGIVKDTPSLLKGGSAE